MVPDLLVCEDHQIELGIIARENVVECPTALGAFEVDTGLVGHLSDHIDHSAQVHIRHRRQRFNQFALPFQLRLGISDNLCKSADAVFLRLGVDVLRQHLKAMGQPLGDQPFPVVQRYSCSPARIADHGRG